MNKCGTIFRGVYFCSLNLFVCDLQELFLVAVILHAAVVETLQSPDVWLLSLELLLLTDIKTAWPLNHNNLYLENLLYSTLDLGEPHFTMLNTV